MNKTFVATLLASAFTLSIAAQAADAPGDTASYRTMTQKAATDYKAAVKNCTGMSGNNRTLCVEEAKVARARAEADAVTQNNNTPKDLARTRTALANAEFALAKVRCAGMTGAEKDNCVGTARSVHTAALADAKSDRNTALATTTGAVSPITGTDTRDPTKAAAVEKCAQIAGQPDTGCVIDNSGRTAAETAAAKTERAAETVAAKTERAIDTAAQKTERAGEVVAEKTERVAEKTSAAVSDAVITTKVKADIFKEPELKAMAIHVETEKGVVMLSGFVDSKADAEKAVRLAKGVEGVTQVKSAIKVK